MQENLVVKKATPLGARVWTSLLAVSYTHLAYTSLDINGDGVYLLAQIGISAHFYQMLPYLITIIVLAFTSKSSRAPKAEGIPYDKGSR